MIYHILTEPAWNAVQNARLYRSESLDQEGFIHCTGDFALLVQVANRFYRHMDAPFVVLCIDEGSVAADIKWEAADGHLFPHIYGPLNLDAVVDVMDFPRRADGSFAADDAWYA